MVEPRTCKGCNTEMAVGFIPTSKGGASLFQAAWHPGPPEDKSFWESIKMGFTGAKVDESKLFPIYAHRCPGCGLVELHAPSPK
jgi:hypothetical protein